MRLPTGLVPEGHRRLAGGANHRFSANKSTSPGRGGGNRAMPFHRYRGSPHFPCISGGWHHRLISVMPPIFARLRRGRPASGNHSMSGSKFMTRSRLDRFSPYLKAAILCPPSSILTRYRHAPRSRRPLNHPSAFASAPAPVSESESPSPQKSGRALVSAADSRSD